jgi:hypothetical protein
MDKTQVIGRFFSEQPDIVLLEEFRLDSALIKGAIQVSLPPATLRFNVEIPREYPFGNIAPYIRFICLDANGYRYQMTDNSICLHPQKTDNLLEKLEEETNMLRDWIKDYYLDDKKGGRYEYPVNTLSDGEQMIFSGVNGTFNKGECGTFKYIDIAPSVNDLSGRSLTMVKRIGQKECEWSHLYMSMPDKEGLYVYIEDEPFAERYRMAKTWTELEKYLPQKLLNILSEVKQNAKKGKIKEKEIKLLLGYLIPGKQGPEVHWELIKVPVDAVPIEGVRKDGKWMGKCLDQEIRWSHTVNTSYDRFFGRGGLDKALTDVKILLIGAGAIGSSLGQVFARGGVKDLAIIEYDKVETGNVCRAQYEFGQAGELKSLHTAFQLAKISPFINVHSAITMDAPAFIDKSLQEPAFSATRSYLNRFDYIFDCSTDMELSYVIDKVKPRGIVINFSISDKAQEFVCVTGHSN